MSRLRGQNRPPKSNFTKARTFQTLPKAEPKEDVQGEASGAFSWIRIWSFFFPGREAQRSGQVEALTHSFSTPRERRKAFSPCSSPLPQGDPGDREKSSGLGH